MNSLTSSAVSSRAARRFSAAQVVGATAVNALAQLAIHSPSELYGAKDEITLAGGIMVAASMILASLALWNLLRQGLTRHLVIPSFYSLGIGAFVPVLAADPILAGAALLWNLTLLTQYFFPVSLREEPFRLTEKGSAIRQWVEENAAATRHLILSSLAVTAVTLGFQSSRHLLASAICLVLFAIALGSATPLLRQLAAEGKRGPWLILILVVGAFLTHGRSGLPFGFLALALMITLFHLARQSEAFAEFIHLFFGNPTLLIVGSFAAIIGVGTILLSFPAAAAANQVISPLDAFFTATSATCVTGLVVLDTPTAFSTFGHVTLLLLIQLGGLNIMVLSAFAAQLLGRSLGPRGELAIGEVLDHRPVKSSVRLVRFIILATLIIEGMGALTLLPAFRSLGLPWGEALWRSVFHSISAFCNAGFALQSDSLMTLNNHPLTLLAFSLLVISGGLGFGVLAYIWERTRRRRGGDYQTHARMVLSSTIFLLVFGFCLWFLLEGHRSLEGMALGDRLANSFFQSVTLRTAGFNSVDYSLLHPSTVLWMMVFMFVGASPGGTGGGVKTTTTMMLLGSIPAMLRGRPQAIFFKRRIPVDAVYRAAAIVTIASLVISVGLGLLLLTENQPFEVLLFETISAVATVGLSLGATPALSALGKATVVTLMFIGRIGPLSLALILARRRPGQVRYPQARILVG